MRGQSHINFVETAVFCNFSLCQRVHRTGSKISLSGEPLCCWQKCCTCRWSIGVRVLVFPSQVSKYLYIWETYSMTLCQSGLSVLISSSMSCVRHNNSLGATDRGCLIPGGGGGKTVTSSRVTLTVKSKFAAFCILMKSQICLKAEQPSAQWPTQ